MRKKVISATVTPLLENGEFDRPGLKNILERNIRHGLDGVFLFGSMGEWGSLAARLKEEALEFACGLVRHRMELLAGINATSLPLSLEIMRSYRKYDFDAYVFMPPGKTSKLDPVRSVLKVLDAADRPVYLYHCPPNNGINFTLDQFLFQKGQAILIGGFFRSFVSIRFEVNDAIRFLLACDVI